MVVRKRLDITGPALVFVTTTVRNWMPLFEDRDCAHQVLRQLEETCQHFRASVTAYVLMPSHLHALLGFTRVEQLSRAMQSFKSLSTRKVRPLISPKWSNVLNDGGNRSMWRPRFDDLVIWSNEQFQIKADYIHNNPVKAGLVEQSTDYPFSSAGDWLLGRLGLIKVDKDWRWQDE